MPHQVVLLEAIPTNLSGKVDYRSLPKPATVVAPARAHTLPSTDIEHLLAGIWRDLLGAGQVGVHDNFFEIGGDSILSLQMVARAADAGLPLSTREVFERPTIAELSRTARWDEPMKKPDSVGVAPLSPSQGWFVAQELKAPHHWNMGRSLTLAPGCETEWVQDAIDYVFVRHEALRSRLDLQPGGMQLYVSPAAAPPAVRGIEIPDRDRAARRAEVVDALQSSIDVENGPVVQAVLLRYRSHPDELVMVVHHAMIDWVSWGIIAADIGLVLSARRAGRPVPQPAPAGAFTGWADQMSRTASEVADEIDWWLNALPRSAPLLAGGGPGGPDLERDQRMSRLTLDPVATDRLVEVAGRLRTQVDELLIATVVHSIARWSQQDDVLIDIERHGRGWGVVDLDLTDTVGWFTSIYPLWLPAVGTDLAVAVREVKQRQWAVPRNGAGFGLLRYHPATRDRLVELPLPPIVFNFLGEADAGTGSTEVALCAESLPGARDGGNRRPHQIAVEAAIVGGRLQVEILYGTAHDEADVAQLCELLRDDLVQIPELGRRAPEMWDPSDFPLATLSASAVEKIGTSYPDAVDVYPLTPPQEGLLFHSLLDPSKGLYVEQRTWIFSGPLDLDKLQRTWRALVNGYEVFRTAFVWEGVPEPVQVVRAEASLSITYHDLSAGKEAADDALDGLLREDRAQGFDFSAAPLMRVTVCRLDASRWAMVWTAHHLLLDGWSNAVIVRELFEDYSAQLSGRDREVAKAPSVRELVRWLKDNEAKRDDGVAYWRDYLAGFATATALPIRRSSDPTPEYVEVNRPVPTELAERLETVARQWQVTPSTVIHAAWGLLLSRYAGEEDVVFGSVASGRPPDLPGVERLVGLCITTTPTRIKVDSSTTVLPWLRTIQQEHVQQREFEHTPLVDIHEFSDVPRGQPLFKSLLVVENYPTEHASTDSLAGAGVRLIAERIVSPVAYDLRCCVLLSDQPMLMLGFMRDQFDAAAVDYLGRQLLHVIDELLANGDGKLTEVRLVLDDMLARATRPLPATSQPTVANLVRDWVTRTPAAVAVRHGERSLTYLDLDRLIGRVTQLLRDAGVSGRQAVAVTGTRSPELVAAMAAVLAHDAVLVPVDSALPHDRQRDVITRAGCRAVITSGALDPQLGSWATRVAGDGDISLLDPPTEHASRAYPDDVAYVVYTSGSTGGPKGIAGSHRGLSHFLSWQRHEFAIRTGDASLLLTSLSFDVVLRDAFLCLVSGATLVIPTSDGMPAAVELAAVIEREGITILHVVPTIAEWWLAELPPGAASAGILRVTFFAGEPLPGELVARWRSAFGSEMEVVNMYGPAETTLAVCCYRVPPFAPEAVLPLGRPIPDVEVLMLAADGSQLGGGEPGEIVIRSPYRSHGYLDRGAETFKRSHLVGGPGEADLWYWTGDRGRIGGDGVVEFLGRDDEQVKLRGVRVDLHAVANVAMRHPGVAACCVAVIRDRRDEPMLTAYVVLDRDRATTHTSIRDFMRRSLPAEAVPGAFVTMPRLPMLPSGKVDREALPAPALHRPSDLGPPVAPRTDDEERICALWRESLALDEVGVTDDFLALGGHSLIAIRLVSRVQEELGVEMPLRMLFEQPTVAQMAQWVAAARDDTVTAAPAAITSAARERVDEAYRRLQDLPEEVRQRLFGGAAGGPDGR
jgi:amino acid adenylation domain-containing protein/non-ribosomal peptide synthase protein (TIGR01720 family)